MVCLGLVILLTSTPEMTTQHESKVCSEGMTVTLASANPFNSVNPPVIPTVRNQPVRSLENHSHSDPSKKPSQSGRSQIPPSPTA